jgi:hypothetical protein
MNTNKLLLIAVAATLGLAIACGESLEDILIDAVCDSDDDCAPKQNCYRTLYQQVAGGQGWCRNDSSCSRGTQPGCTCDQTGVEYSCRVTTESGVVPTTNNGNCECAYECTNGASGEKVCPQGLEAFEPEMPTGASCYCVIPGGL